MFWNKAKATGVVASEQGMAIGADLLVGGKLSKKYQAHIRWAKFVFYAAVLITIVNPLFLIFTAGTIAWGWKVLNQHKELVTELSKNTGPDLRTMWRESKQFVDDVGEEIEEVEFATN